MSSPEELERQRQAELVEGWEVRLEKVARGRLESGRAKTIEDARRLTMETDHQLQLPRFESYG